MKNLNLSPEQWQQQLSPIQAELARRRFFDFTKFTKPDFIEGWFNRLVAQELQQFYDDVVAGKQPRLMIFAPPRSGKSELFSRRFPAWVLGKNPDLQIIASSYSSDLSSRMNRDVQRIIDDTPYRQVFPGTSLNGKNVVTVANNSLRNSEIFEVVGHAGAYRSAGVGGGITGMGADIAIIDDPVKDAKEAKSSTIRASIWDWYTTTLYTRLSPASGILLGMTRWHEDDLAGRLLEAHAKGEGDEWRIVRFPAIAEQDELYRKAGEPLHPERYPLERLMGIKKAVGTQAWNGLYQQRPSSDGGDIIKGEWFPRYKVVPPLKWRAAYVDTAQKAKQHNDYTVFLHAGMGQDGRVYILDCVRGKFEAVKLEQTARDLWAKWKTPSAYQGTNFRYFAIEDKMSGTGLIQQLKTRHTIPVKPLQRLPGQDKYSRVLDVQGHLESGFVCLPDVASWVTDFTGECEAFTATDSHAHDDQVDTLADCVADMLNGGTSMLDIL